MMQKLNFKILTLCSLMSVLSGCEIDFFSSGGVTIEGTGDPIIDIGHAGEQNGSFILGTRYLEFSTPEQDTCHGVERKLTFLNPLDREKIDTQTFVEIPAALSELNSQNVRLTLKNTNSVPVTIQLQCDMPLTMQLDEQVRPYFPKQTCETPSEIKLYPQQQHVFEAAVNLETVEVGTWSHGVGTAVEFKGNTGEKCEEMTIHFKQSAKRIQP
ncbi:hypothetical protein ABD624_00345 [Avibacterium paragallinarum]